MITFLGVNLMDLAQQKKHSLRYEFCRLLDRECWQFLTSFADIDIVICLPTEIQEICFKRVWSRHWPGKSWHCKPNYNDQGWNRRDWLVALMLMSTHLFPRKFWLLIFEQFFIVTGKLVEKTMMRKFGVENVNEHFISFNTICHAAQVISSPSWFFPFRFL